MLDDWKTERLKAITYPRPLPEGNCLDVKKTGILPMSIDKNNNARPARGFIPLLPLASFAPLYFAVLCAWNLTLPSPSFRSHAFVCLYAVSCRIQCAVCGQVRSSRRSKCWWRRRVGRLSGQAFGSYDVAPGFAALPMGYLHGNAGGITSTRVACRFDSFLILNNK